MLRSRVESIGRRASSARPRRRRAGTASGRTSRICSNTAGGALSSPSARGLPWVEIDLATALLAATVVGLFGSTIALTAAGQDPAQSASIILTTVTDVVGFASFLGIATALSGLL